MNIKAGEDLLAVILIDQIFLGNLERLEFDVIKTGYNPGGVGELSNGFEANFIVYPGEDEGAIDIRPLQSLKRNIHTKYTRIVGLGLSHDGSWWLPPTKEGTPL